MNRRGSLRSPWKKAFIPFLGETRNLDDIEHGLLRGAPKLDEPRIHFSVNCASIGGTHGFLARYPDALRLTSADAAMRRAGAARINFFDYDWSLNDRTIN